ncbi:MAG: hypothetical protein HY329_23485 [Chloroflexi bacterium]|nr:hypothetical protein [Chloroflexota bacterium]
MAAGIVVGRMNIPAELETAYNEWYNAEHLTGTVAVSGFVRGRRYVQVYGENSPAKYATVYDLESPNVVEGEGYAAWTASFASRNTFGYREIRPKFQDFTKFIGEQIFPIGAPYEPPAAAEYLLLMMSEPEDGLDEEFNAWYDTEHIPLLLQVPGILTARRFRAVAGSDGPRYIAIYDLASPDVFQGEHYEKLRTTPWTLRIRSRYKNRLRFVGRRVSPVVTKP